MGKSKNEKSDIERFRRMAVVLANHTGVSQASDYFALPTGIRRHYEVMTYTELIRPLVYRDRMERNRSWQQIAVYYKISVQSARTIISTTARAPLCCQDPG